MHCVQCGNKATKYRAIDPNTHTCNKCVATAPQIPIDLDNNKQINELPLKDFQTWLQQTSAVTIGNEMQKVRADLTAEINNLKTGLEATKKEVAKAKADIADLYKKGETTNTELNDVSTGVENCTKYLINLDRETRRKNVILFGVPETSILIGEEEINTDQANLDHIFDVIGVNAQVINKFMRLGKENEGSSVPNKPRPIKLILDSDTSATSVLTEGHKLSSLNPLTIYIKPDKSKAEVAEFQRMGKRKTELLKQYPTQGNEEPRIKLERGKLTVDGIVVDTYKPVQSLF